MRMHFIISDQALTTGARRNISFVLVHTHSKEMLLLIWTFALPVAQSSTNVHKAFAVTYLCHGLSLYGPINFGCCLNITHK